MLSQLWEPPPPKRCRRGGWRQDEIARSSGDVEHASISRLAGGLLQYWCNGLISAQKLQQHIEDAKCDGLKHAMLDKLASIGSGQNAQGCLLKLLSSCGLMALIEDIDGPSGKIVLPSTWIGLLHKQYRREFRLRLGADQERLRGFGKVSLGGLGRGRGHNVTPTCAIGDSMIWSLRYLAACTPTLGPSRNG